eukprot:Nk52_evm66s239 gene=Nk52_evmTU66s239
MSKPGTSLRKTKKIPLGSTTRGSSSVPLLTQLQKKRNLGSPTNRMEELDDKRHPAAAVKCSETGTDNVDNQTAGKFSLEERAGSTCEGVAGLGKGEDRSVACAEGKRDDNYLKKKVAGDSDAAVGVNHNIKKGKGKHSKSGSIESLNDLQSSKPRLAPYKSSAEKDSFERDLYEKHGKELRGTLGKQFAKKPASSVSSSTPGNLTTALLSRVNQLESELYKSQTEVAEKMHTIARLEERIMLLEVSGLKNVEFRGTFLEKKCKEYRKQIEDMEDFLADYGLVWVGNDIDLEGEFQEPDKSDEGKGQISRLISKEISFQDNNGNVTNSTAQEEQPSVPRGTEGVFNFGLFVKNLKELSCIAGEDVAIVVPSDADGKTHSLKAPDSIPVKLYSNGFMLWDGPFRPFDSDIAKSFIEDVFDGYFPIELKERYPDGVPFQITDKRFDEYTGNMASCFSGAGKSLTNNNPKQRNSELGSNQGIEFDPLTKNEKGLLQKLPRSVIRNGKVINIQDSLKEHVSTDIASPAPTKKVMVLDNAEDDTQEAVSSDEASGMMCTTLQIKNDFSSHSFVMKLKETTSIAELRNRIDKLLPKGSETSYEIRSTFPSRVYNDRLATLKQCGLTPTATLHVRKL